VDAEQADHVARVKGAYPAVKFRLGGNADFAFCGDGWSNEGLALLTKRWMLRGFEKIGSAGQCPDGQAEVVTNLRDHGLLKDSGDSRPFLCQNRHSMQSWHV
jgi:hypothetical protein